MKINFTEVTDIEDLRSIPPGEYPCQVAEVCESRSPASHIRWGMRWEVLFGDWEGPYRPLGFAPLVGPEPCPGRNMFSKP